MHTKSEFLPELDQNKKSHSTRIKAICFALAALLCTSCDTNPRQPEVTNPNTAIGVKDTIKKSKDITYDLHIDEGNIKIVIYNNKGKVLYKEEFPGPNISNSPNESETYDEKGRLISYKNSNNYEIKYNDKNNTKTTIITPFDGKTTRIIIETYDGKIISDEIRGEAGNIIDVKNGGLEELFKKMGIDTINRFDAQNYSKGINRK